MARERLTPGTTEIICGRHWRLVPKPYRRVYTRAVRRFNRRPTERLARIGNRLWDRCIAFAIEAAGGIA